MSMGNNFSNATNNNAGGRYQGKIISCYRKYLNNNDINSSVMHGMLKYMASNNSVETIEYYTQQNDLNVDDIVTFNFSNDKAAFNPYANGVIKHNFNEMKQENNNNYSHSNVSTSSSTRNSRDKKKDMKSQYPVRLICISDTHNSHDQLTQELKDIYRCESDILIHCGDMTDSGSVSELKRVNKWFGSLPYKHIIITAGNMDGIGLDKNKYEMGRKSYNGYNNYDQDSNITNMTDSDSDETSTPSLGHSIFTNAIYLEHESYYLQEFNIRFFASPYSMRFVGGFQINNNKQAESKWKQIPSNTDILICHGPPLNILDSTSRGKHTGDEVLYNHVIKRIKPKVMCFGHMHSSFGYKKSKGIHFYNCAQNNSLNGNHSYSYYNSNKKNNNMKKETPHIINLSKLD